MSHRCTNPDLFLSGMPADIKPGKVREFFERVHVETSYTEVLRKDSTSCAFVRLAHRDNTERAIELLNGLKIENLRVRKYLPKATAKPRASFHSPEHPTWRGEWQANEAAR
jgi:RNA recognition motif-containing protein